MELKEIFKFFGKQKKSLVIFFIFGVLIGAGAFYLLPAKYVSKGTLYVARKPEENEEYYTYSGYYAQQVGLSYTKTVRGLLEDGAIHSEVLEKLKIPITEKSLRKFKNRVKVKDAGPQLVGLEIKENSTDKANKTWNILAEIIEDTSLEINQEGDPYLYITRVKEEPVVQETYKDLYLFGITGGLFLLGLGTCFLALKNYLKEGEDD